METKNPEAKAPYLRYPRHPAPSVPLCKLRPADLVEAEGDRNASLGRAEAVDGDRRRSEIEGATVPDLGAAARNPSLPDFLAEITFQFSKEHPILGLDASGIRTMLQIQRGNILTFPSKTARKHPHHSPHADSTRSPTPTRDRVVEGLHRGPGHRVRRAAGGVVRRPARQPDPGCEGVRRLAVGPVADSKLLEHAVAWCGEDAAS